MENTMTMASNAEETNQRLKAYLKRHKVKQNDFVIKRVEAALVNKPPDST